MPCLQKSFSPFLSVCPADLSVYCTFSSRTAEGRRRARPHERSKSEKKNVYLYDCQSLFHIATAFRKARTCSRDTTLSHQSSPSKLLHTHSLRSSTTAHSHLGTARAVAQERLSDFCQKSFLQKKSHTAFSLALRAPRHTRSRTGPMADLISSDSNKQSDNIRFNNKHYEPRPEDISDLRPWGTKKYDRAGGYADVSI